MAWQADNLLGNPFSGCCLHVLASHFCVSVYCLACLTTFGQFVITATELEGSLEGFRQLVLLFSYLRAVMTAMKFRL